ncbi:MAG: beta-galactosidase [Lachnospiraceae bacterium]|nr:beta-galactosidase [Lachnospiraceae bacterium]
MTYSFKTYEKSAILRGHLRMGGDNPAGERINVNSLYLERGGKPWLGVMGEYHFSRDCAANWHEELCKMKAGGVNIVSTYMFWIHHEEIEGEFDFTGDRDIRRFVEECRKFKLDVFLRIGPWSHGECRNGGFPDWLLQKPFKLREDNDGYLKLVRIWYEKIYEQVQGLFYKDGGPIIGIQLENELVDRPEHLLTLKKLALKIGFDVPLYTVTGWNSKYGAKIPVDEVLPVFGAYAEAPWDSHTGPLPLSRHYVFHPVRNDTAVGVDVMRDTDKSGWRLPYERYPFLTCEVGPGLQSTHHRRVLVSGMDAYAMSLTKLGSGNNLLGYYMYHGGVNPIGKLSTMQESRETGYPNDYAILSYDFHTAMTSYGEVREQYRLLNLLHLFVTEFGEKLAPMEYVGSAEAVEPEDLKSLRYCMRTDGESGFVFVNHYQRLARVEDLRGVVIDTETAAVQSGNETDHAVLKERVVFPPIDVCGDVSFILPFNLDLQGNLLKYATAQPLTREGNTYFFAQIEGIDARYQFAGSTAAICPDIAAEAMTKKPGGQIFSFLYKNIRIVTIPWQQARFLRKLDGAVYIGKDCDLYLADGKVKAVQEGSFAYLKWNGSDFEAHSVEKVWKNATYCVEKIAKTEGWPEEERLRELFCQDISRKKCIQPEDKGGKMEDKSGDLYTGKFRDELSIGGSRRLTWYRLSADSPEGFIDISEPCDTCQLYADGTFVADKYYDGEPWRFPASLVYGKDCVIVLSQIKNDCYREV